ncbi:MAG: hypothetical protein N3B12_03490 [Armatimonadetes bacterium]|nr:hypothetical protein [Armatimonadota bacterium]
MVDQPDLPGLESVEEEITEGWPCCCCLPVPIVIIGGVVQGYWIYGLIFSVLLILLTLILSRLSDYRIKTDSWELTARWPFRTIRIPWAEVTHAKTITVESNTYERFIRVEAPGRKIEVPVAGLDMARLEASVWQHLRRYRKADGVTLSDDALSFWLPIPDDIPSQMDWEMPCELDWAPLARYSLRPRYILCEFVEPESYRKSRAIEWLAVKSADWEVDDKDCLTLSIESESESIYIPLDPDDPTSARFLLAVIRRLRSLEHIKPLPIPRKIRELMGLTTT